MIFLNKTIVATTIASLLPNLMATEIISLSSPLSSANHSVDQLRAIADSTLIVTYSSEAGLSAIISFVTEQEIKGNEISITSLNNFTSPQKVAMPVVGNESGTSNGTTSTYGVTSTLMGYTVISTLPNMTNQHIDLLFNIEGVVSVERDKVYTVSDVNSLRGRSVQDHVHEIMSSIKEQHLLRVSSSSSSYSNESTATQLKTVREASSGRQLTEEIPYGITMVNVAPLWTITPTQHVKICVVDSGYDYGHPDLPTFNVNGWETGSANVGVWSTDENGHGTHCSGIIGAIGSNNIGVTGVLPDASKFSFHIAKVFDKSGSGLSSDVLNAVQGCVNAGAKVISLSLGSHEYSIVEKAFYQNIYNDGVLLIAAAGNDGYEINQYPSAYKTVMSVGSVQSGKMYSSFSTTNIQVEIAAPGSDVLSTVPRPVEYDLKSGTSMACPHVSGIAALLISHFPTCTNNQIRNALIRTTTEPPLGGANIPGWDKQYGWGIVNAEAAYNLLQTQGCVGAGGAYPDASAGISLSDQALGGKNQKQMACTNDSHCIGAKSCSGQQKCNLATNVCYVEGDPCIDVGPFILQSPLCYYCYVGVNGQMFDVVAKNVDIVITSMKINSYVGAILEVWTRVGTHVGFYYSSNGWTKVATLDLTGTSGFVTIPESSFSQAISISAGSRQAFYVTFQASGQQYFSPPSHPTIDVEDDYLVIYNGVINYYPFGLRSNDFWKWNGALIYKFQSHTSSPTVKPTTYPSKKPTNVPTKKPTRSPTKSPTNKPTSAPSKKPTSSPTKQPTNAPTKKPTSSSTKSPTNKPTSPPSKKPTFSPTKFPTKNPTSSPTKKPGSNKWYMNYSLGFCVMDCKGASPCGGLASPWDILFTTKEECCATKNWWNGGCIYGSTTSLPSKSPTKKPTQIPAGSNKWYMNYSFGYCVMDCGGKSPCGGLASSWDILFDTKEACCAAKNWWNGGCVYSSKTSLPTKSPTKKPIQIPTGTNKWYHKQQSGKCFKDCNGFYPCGGLAKPWDPKYGTKSACCAAQIWWRRAFCMAF